MHIASCWAKVHLTGHFASCTYVFADQVIIDHSLCYSLVLFWTANSNMNKSMQILSEEILVICVGRFPVIIFFVLNERNGKITLKAGQWKIRNLGKKAFSLVHFYILIILLKRRSIFLCFKGKRSCFFDVLDVLFFLERNLQRKTWHCCHCCELQETKSKRWCSTLWDLVLRLQFYSSHLENSSLTAGFHI